MVTFCLFLLFVFLFVFVFLVDLFSFFVSFVSLPAWRRCTLLATFLSVVFCLLPLLFSERVPGLVWLGSVYLVTTAGFVADQLLCDKQQTTAITHEQQ